MKRLLVATILFSFSTNLFSLSDEGPTLMSDFSSPLSTNAKYITMGGLLVSGLVYLNKSSRTYRKRESYDDAKPFGDYGFIGNHLGYGLLNVMYVGSAYVYGKSYNNKEAIDSSKHMAKASLFSLGITMALKKTINERRPGYPDDPDSFPSGHSSASFAFASVIAARHGWYWGGSAYALASFISFSRINDDYHYLHDVIFGMTIGASYGWGTYFNYKSKSNYTVSLLPTYGGASLSLTMPMQ